LLGVTALYTVGYWVNPEELWYEQGYGQSAQWAELHAVWCIIKEEDSPIHIAMDSWTVYKRGYLYGYHNGKAKTGE
jgi:hypothetical protein